MMPSPLAEPELYALIVAALFIPWRSAAGLLGGAVSFADRLARTVLPAWASDITVRWAEWARVQSDMHTSRAALLKKMHDPDLEGTFQCADGQGADRDDDCCSHDDDDGGANELLREEPRLQPSTQRSINDALCCGLISSATKASAPLQTPPARKVDAAARSCISAALEHYCNMRAEQNAVDDNAVGPDEDFDALMACAEQQQPLRPPAAVAGAKYDPNAVHLAVGEVEALMSSGDKLVHFNAEQRFAVAIGIAHILGLDTGLGSIRLCITGEAGCGKTVFAKAIGRFLAERGMEDQLCIMAWTGSAARTAGGQTICSALQLSPFNMSPICSEKAKSTLRRKFSRVCIVIIDEISLVSAATLALIDYRLRVAKDSNDLFGGLCVFFIGDYYQLGPVGERSLFVPLTDETSSGATARVAALRNEVLDSVKKVPKDLT